MEKIVRRNAVLCLLVAIVFVMPISALKNEGVNNQLYDALSVKNSDIKIKPPLSPGDYLRFMFFDMRLRSYRIHVPPSYDGSNPVPLVVVLHAFPGNAKQIQSVGMNAKADEEGFIAVYPNGHIYLNIAALYFALMNLINYGSWGFYFNCWDFDNVNDVGFIQTLIETLQMTLEIDSSRIYITGLSGGGVMTYRLGAELSDIVAAIAPVAGSIGGKWNDEPYIIPEPEHPLSVIVFHGMKDSAVPYEGSEDFISVNDSVAFWVEHNQCNPIPDVKISESGNIITRTYTGGSDGAEVVFYTVVDGVHGWFGAPEWPYEYPCEISATNLIWDFFEQHSKQ